MKKLSFPIVLFSLFFLASPLSIALADDGMEINPQPVTAEEAFWSVQTDTDPLSGEPTKVALIDVRTRAEYFWVGAASEVTSITLTNGKVIEPDYGYARLIHSGRFLTFEVEGRKRWVNARKVEALAVAPIAKSIPLKLWDETNPTKGGMYLNEEFEAKLEALAAEGFNTLIFFCRSGGRSESWVNSVTFPANTFDAYYEIDHPDSESGGVGGFEGTSYGNVYNGYRGFPGRITRTQEFDSVSWKDSGLPSITGATPE